MDLCLTGGALFKATGAFPRLQLHFIKLTASLTAECWRALRDEVKERKMNCSVCALFIYLLSHFRTRAPLATCAGRKAPTFKSLQPISCFKTSEKASVQNWHFFLSNIFERDTTAAPCSQKGYRFPRGKLCLPRSHRPCTDQIAECTSPHFSLQWPHLEPHEL